MFDGGTMALILFLLAWGVPLTLLVWFVRTLTTMAVLLRDIADRLVALERAVRDASTHHSI
jgi:hypothetical protein